jgi:hypothetical protein
MRVSNALVAFAVLLLTSCKKDVVQTRVYDNVLYEVNPVTLYESNAQKTKQKSSLQYISILYTDLFNQSIPANKLNKMSEAALSIGDKAAASDLIMQKWLVEPGVQIPTDNAMRADLQQFVTDTYLRFFQRYPTPYESYFLKKTIDDDPAVTPALVYAAFALSNEYYYY